jgi:predicted negative regulator of RcsB-dependent stress response
MTRNPAARRVHRDDSAPDDKFVAGVLETSVWAKTHGRTLLIGGGIAALVLIVAGIFWTSRSSKTERANSQLVQVRATAMSGNPQLAVRDLEAFVRNFGSTRAGDEGRLLLGKAYLDMDSTAKAIAAVQSLADDLESDAGVNAAMLIAAAHEAANEPKLAEAEFLRVGEGARFLFQKQEALDNAARVRMQSNNAAGAVEIYERLLTLTPESNQEWPVYQLRLGEARAAANAGAAPASAAPATGTPAPAAGTPTAPPATTGG